MQIVEPGVDPYLRNMSDDCKSLPDSIYDTCYRPTSGSNF